MQNKTVTLTPRETAEQKYKSARSNLLLMLAFTLVNIVLAFVKSDTMFLFSATVPYMTAVAGAYSEDSIFLGIWVCITVIIMVLYFLCWLLSKRHYGWMVGALVLFVIDTLVMAGVYLTAQDFSGILDVVFHVWILYYLIIGVKNGRKLDGYAKEEQGEFFETTEDTVPAYEQPEQVSVSSGYSADWTVKYRVLAETEAEGYRICYRRVKRVNELVINDYVYDSVEMLVEPAHILTASVDGHLIEAGFDGVAHSFINVDGVTVQKKMRLY